MHKKGKIEAFNRTVDAFLAEVALDKPQTLEALNDSFDRWLKEYYHKRPHSGLDGLTPEVAFRCDKRALRFADAKDLAEAFLHTETRKVDKTGCIRFGGKKYEVGMKLMGRKVEVHYDPTWTDEVEIHHKDFEPLKAKVQVIGTNCGSRQTLPEGVNPLDVQSSRLLDALNKDNTTGRTNNQRAVSYNAIGGQI